MVVASLLLNIMNSIKRKHIIIGLVISFILYLFVSNGDGDSADQTQSRTFLQPQRSYHSLEYEQGYSSSSTWSPNPSSSTRHEILQTTEKGYREETYWGEHTSTDEKVRYMDDDEFNDYLEEVELNDVDVYWGAEY